MLKIDHIKSESMNGIFINMSRADALRLLASLSNQILNDNPNSQREEWMSSSIKGSGRGMSSLNYFTIAVEPEQPGPEVLDRCEEILKKFQELKKTSAKTETWEVVNLLVYEIDRLTKLLRSYGRLK